MRGLHKQLAARPGIAGTSREGAGAVNKCCCCCAQTLDGGECQRVSASAPFPWNAQAPDYDRYRPPATGSLMLGIADRHHTQAPLGIPAQPRQDGMPRSTLHQPSTGETASPLHGAHSGPANANQVGSCA